MNRVHCRFCVCVSADWIGGDGAGHLRPERPMADAAVYHADQSVHTALLYNGKVLIVSGSGNVAGNTNFQAALWDPQAATITAQTGCLGHVLQRHSGAARWAAVRDGGTLQYDPFHGELSTATYDPATNTFTNQQAMAHGRWYPTETVLGDGRTMVFLRPY